MIIPAFIIFAYIVLTSCNDNSTNPLSEQEFWQEIDAFVTEHMNPEGSGYGITVIKDGEMLFSQGWGMANIADGIPFTSNTPTNLASLTKQFTAVAVLILFEQDSLDLDDTILNYFPEFPAEWSEVTVHHLLTHQSGIPNYTDSIDSTPQDYDGLTNQMALELVLQNSSLDFTPGKQTSYSNTGYLILALLIEKISGKDYPDFLQENIFAPLEMQSTFVKIKEAVNPPNLALPYDENNGLYNVDCYIYGDGGIYSTLNDMFKWDQALYTDQIISQTTLQLALAGYTGGSNNYGYGWMVGSYGGYPSYRHGGFFLGFLNYIYRIPGKDFTYLMLSNGGVFANNGFESWTEEVKDRIFARYL